MRILNTNDLNNPITISKVGPDISALAFNDRGGLMAYADTKGEIKFKEITKKLYVRNFNTHSKAVYALQFIPKSTLLVSGGDDMNIFFVDFSTGQLVHSLKKVHSDFIRTIQCFQGNQNLVLSGSFDKTAKIFDVRESSKLKLTFKHEAEVEDCKLYKSDTGLVTVGDKFVPSSHPDQSVGHAQKRRARRRPLQQHQDCQQHIHLRRRQQTLHRLGRLPPQNIRDGPGALCSPSSKSSTRSSTPNPSPASPSVRTWRTSVSASSTAQSR